MTKRIFLDLGEYGHLSGRGVPIQTWHDHGLGLMRTILHANGLATSLASRRWCYDVDELSPQLAGYDMLLMNVRSYTFEGAKEAARIFKTHNPKGVVLTGGMHATVDLGAMEAVEDFDHIVTGGGEAQICDLVRDHSAFPRVMKGEQAKSMAEWPMIDRMLWPRERNVAGVQQTWPLEGSCGWGNPPVATVMTSRVCPYACNFCSEFSYIPNMNRRPVEMVIDELNFLDKKYGVGSVVIHDSMFYLQPDWLEEWLDKYPKKARNLWPYWAAGRADTVRKWPELFEALVKETNWSTVSIGFESGSDRTLKTLNKECTAEDNLFTIDLLNRIGDDMEAEGKVRPRFWSNIMYGIPGETPEDVFATKRMIKRMKNPILTPATYAPFPGSMLGYQITAEGKSHLGRSHFRFQGGRYMDGIDYDFLSDVESGAYESDIDEKDWLPDANPKKFGEGDKRKRSKFFLFPLKNGRKRLAHGETVEEAKQILSWRCSPEEMAQILDAPPLEVRQQDVHPHLKDLG